MSMVQRNAPRQPRTAVGDPLLIASDAARYLGLTDGHLRRMRAAGTGPKAVRSASGQWRYRLSDLEAWASAGGATS